MHVLEHLYVAKDPLISFEIIPPERQHSFARLERVIEDLVHYNPPFIDVTSHAAAGNGRRNRIGTLGICAVIRYKYGIDAVPHVLCYNFTQQETEDFLLEHHYMGGENVLALQGDKKGDEKVIPASRTKNVYASDLVTQIANLNAGYYLSGTGSPTDFCIGVAGYPEDHPNGTTVKENLEHLKLKLNNGGHYVVTQMFFDNTKYFSYVKNCRTTGITVPIIPGLKIITSKKHLQTLPGPFGCDFPEELKQEIISAKDKHVSDIGIKWAVQQAEELLVQGAPSLHFYVMQNIKPVKQVMDKLF